MKERPILFSAPMVRAILAGNKTQTRRIVKEPCQEYLRNADGSAMMHGGEVWNYSFEQLLGRCPYGQPGDRLWVRETFYAWGRWETRFSPKKSRDEWHFIDMTRDCGKEYWYDATGRVDHVGLIAGKGNFGGVIPCWWKRPSIHMPRWVSRILPEITGVRVERLNDISETDAKAEGVEEWARGACAKDNPMGYTNAGYFSLLWESINGAGSWDANPWVWVVEFKKIERERE